MPSSLSTGDYGLRVWLSPGPKFHHGVSQFQDTFEERDWSLEQEGVQGHKGVPPANYEQAFSVWSALAGAVPGKEAAA